MENICGWLQSRPSQWSFLTSVIVLMLSFQDKLCNWTVASLFLYKLLTEHAMFDDSLKRMFVHIWNFTISVNISRKESIWKKFSDHQIKFCCFFFLMKFLALQHFISFHSTKTDDSQKKPGKYLCNTRSPLLTIVIEPRNSIVKSWWL